MNPWWIVLLVGIVVAPGASYGFDENAGLFPEPLSGRESASVEASENQGPVLSADREAADDDTRILLASLVLEKARAKDNPGFSLVLSGGSEEMPLVLVQANNNEKLEEEEVVDTIADPLEPLNRAFFVFNDELYFTLLKPVSSTYALVVPEKARVGVKNFFTNSLFPVRFVSCLLQGKVEGAGNELGRFLLNTFFGVAGFIDVATMSGAFKRYDEDLGQTFGYWGAGPGFYICWPFIGPSSLRDTFGLAGDLVLDPFFNVKVFWLSVGILVLERVNDTSLRIGDFESLKEAALDPYVALREAYYQNRKAKIRE